MYTISKTFSFCYGHRHLGVEHPCRHLHGHNGKITIVMQSPGLDQHGVVRDFDDLKKTIGVWITEHLDHTMILSEHDPILPALRAANERVLAVSFNPTSENLARYVFENARALGLGVVRVDFCESETAKASYGE